MKVHATKYVNRWLSFRFSPRKLSGAEESFAHSEGPSEPSTWVSSLLIITATSAWKFFPGMGKMSKYWAYRRVECVIRVVLRLRANTSFRSNMNNSRLPVELQQPDTIKLSQLFQADVMGERRN